MLAIRDVMTADVITVRPETTLRDAAELFARRHVSGAPVVVGERVVGIISATDLLDFLASNPVVPVAGEEPRYVDEWGVLPGWSVSGDPPAAYFTDSLVDMGEETTGRIADPNAHEWDVLSEHRVDEVMTRKVCSLSPNFPVAAAAEYMSKTGIHRVLVLERERLAGILTSSDVTRAVGEYGIGERRVGSESSPRQGGDEREG